MRKGNIHAVIDYVIVYKEARREGQKTRGRGYKDSDHFSVTVTLDGQKSNKNKRKKVGKEQEEGIGQKKEKVSLRKSYRIWKW